MEILRELIHAVTDPRSLLDAFGPFAYLGLFGIIFAETGLFVGFFLPGDSLLFAAGVFASLGSQGLQLPILVVVCTSAAVLGNLVGYAFGRRVGRPLFERPDSRFFRRHHLIAAEAFYERHGGLTIVIARFLPFVRTFAPIVAGVARMDARRYVTYTIVGGVLWGTGLPVLGYVLGEALGDQVERYLLVLIGGIIILSVLPTALHLARENRGRIRALAAGRVGRRDTARPEAPLRAEPERAED